MSHSLDSHHCAFESLRLIKKGEREKRGCPSFQLKYLWFVKLIFTLAIRNSSLSSCFSENFSLASAWNWVLGFCEKSGFVQNSSCHQILSFCVFQLLNLHPNFGELLSLIAPVYFNKYSVSKSVRGSSPPLLLPFICKIQMRSASGWELKDTGRDLLRSQLLFPDKSLWKLSRWTFWRLLGMGHVWVVVLSPQRCSASPCAWNAARGWTRAPWGYPP